MSEPDLHIAGLVLAAGASSRLGRPKQLVEIDGLPLVRRAVLTALETSCDRIFLVVGANPDRIVEAIPDLDVEVIDNPAWGEGIASSLRAGVSRIADCSPKYEAVLVILADQFRLTPQNLDRLIEAFRIHREIAASEYASTLGVPALFPRKYFDELCRLSGNTGAKSLLLKHATHVARIPCPEASVDLDTSADLAQI